MENKDCIFCKIAASEIPSHKVYEDDLFFGFLDINPMSKGHALLIPKKHVRWVHDVEPFGNYWTAAHTIAQRQKEELHPTWLQYHTFGQVPHAHIHIIPRYDDVESAPALPKMGKTSLSSDEMASIASKIFTASPSSIRQ